MATGGGWAARRLGAAGRRRWAALPPLRVSHARRVSPVTRFDRDDPRALARRATPSLVVLRARAAPCGVGARRPTPPRRRRRRARRPRRRWRRRSPDSRASSPSEAVGARRWRGARSWPCATRPAAGAPPNRPPPPTAAWRRRRPPPPRSHAHPRRRRQPDRRREARRARWRGRRRGAAALGAVRRGGGGAGDDDDGRLRHWRAARNDRTPTLGRAARDARGRIAAARRRHAGRRR